MALTITVQPHDTDSICASSLPILYTVQTDRLKQTETTYNVISVADDGGFNKIELNATPSDLVIGDIMTLSGFTSELSLNTRHKITGISGIYLTLDSAFVADDTGNAIRTNDQFKVKCVISFNYLNTTVLKDINQFVYPYFNGSDCLFDLDLSEYAQQLMESTSINNGLLYSPQDKKSLVTVDVDFFEYFLDKDYVLGYNGDTNAANIEYIALVNLRDADTFRNFIFETATSGNSFLTDNVNQKFDFNNTYKNPCLSFIVYGAVTFKLEFYDGTTTYTLSTAQTGIQRYNLDLTEVFKAPVSMSKTAANIRIKFIFGSTTYATIYFYNETKKFKNKITVLYANRLGGYDTYDFVDIEKGIAVNNDIALLDKTYYKTFADFDKKVTLIGRYESNETMETLMQLLYSKDVLMNNSEPIVITTSEYDYKTDDVKQLIVSALAKREY